MSNKLINILLLSIIVIFSRCSSVDRVVTTYAAKNFNEAAEVVYRESDLKLAKQFLGSNMMTIEIVLNKDPDNRKMNLFAARSFGTYSMAFVEEENKKRAKKLYDRGLKYAINSLPDKKSFTTKINPDKLTSLLKKYNKDEVSYLFWLAYNWGKKIMLNPDDPSNMLNLSKVVKIMSRCKELDEEYYFAGVDLFFGLYWLSRPQMFGGDPKKGREILEKAFELNDKKLYIAKYYIAKYYAPRVKDKELFEKLIQDIKQLDIEKYPNYKLMNALAKKKAEKLEARKKELF